MPLHFYYDISKPVGTLLIRILLYKLCGQDYSCDGVPIIAWMCHARLYSMLWDGEECGGNMGLLFLPIFQSLCFH